MLRLTPVRVLYLIVGLIVGAVIGAIVLFAFISVAGTPAFLTSVIPSPGNTAQTPRATPSVFTGRVLDRVVPINQKATKGAMQVRINTLEEYADGFSLTYSIMGGEPGEPAPVLQPERFTVTDNRGGSYQLSPLGSTATVGPGFSSGYLAFSPALSPAATSLTVSVPHLLVVSDLGEQGTPRVVDGPWQVQVPLK